MDGGIYDNLGLEWFQGWESGRPPRARECDFVVVVDSSGPLAREERRFGWRDSIVRCQAAQYTQSRMSRIRWFMHHLLTGAIRGVYIPIHGDPRSFMPPPNIPVVPGAADGALPVGFAVALSKIRTDLDRFAPDELDTLMYAGYWSAHTRLRHLHPHLAAAKPKWTELAALSEYEKNRLLAIIHAGERRRVWR